MESEWNMLTLLITSYPDYVPYEALLASMTLLPLAECHKLVQKAQQAKGKKLRAELDLVYDTASKIRPKLNALLPHVTIEPFRSVGYELRLHQPKNNVL